MWLLQLLQWAPTGGKPVDTREPSLELKDCADCETDLTCRVFVYQLWNGWPHVGKPELVGDHQNKRKKVRQSEEMEEVLSGQGHGDAGEGEARRAQGEVGQSEGGAGQGEIGADGQEHGGEGHLEGRRRRSGDGGRDLL